MVAGARLWSRPVAVVAVIVAVGFRQVVRGQADLDAGHGPSPYHLEAWRSLKIVDADQRVHAGRSSSARGDVVAALGAARHVPHLHDAVHGDAAVLAVVTAILAYLALLIATRLGGHVGCF